MADVQVSCAAQGNPAGAGCGESDSGLEASPLVHPVYITPLSSLIVTVDLQPILVM